MYSVKCIYTRTSRFDRFLLYIYIKHAALRQFVYDGCALRLDALMHKKNGFAEVSKNSTRYRFENNFKLK